MAIEICIIDDSIPAIAEETIDVAKKLNWSNLNLLLRLRDEWTEPEVKNLVQALVGDRASWNTSAFINPNNFLSACQNEGYRPEIIIYDWHYSNMVDDSFTLLLEILNTTYSLIYVYSGADNRHTIDQALASAEIVAFGSNRLISSTKDEVRPEDVLIKVNELYDNNFSFRFGRDLRLSILKALEDVLIDFCRHDIKFIVNLLSEEGTIQIDIYQEISRRIRNNLANDETLVNLFAGRGIERGAAHALLQAIEGKILDIIRAADIDAAEFAARLEDEPATRETARKLWSSRLYFNAADDIVRKGDIVKHDTKYFMVITADCDLNRFWKKNYGYINLIPLYDIETNSQEIKSRLRTTKTEAQVNNMIGRCSIHSFSDGIKGDGWTEGPFVLPFLPKEDRIFNLMGFPKEILSLLVAFPAAVVEGKDKLSLKYEYWPNYEKLATVSEPFITALAQHCLKSISGYGTPNYPDPVKSKIADILKDSLLPPEQGQQGDE